MTPQRRAATTAAIAAAVVVGTVRAALAGGGGEQIAFNAADQAAARAAIIRRFDLRSKAWTGGPIRPDLRPPRTCRNYRPKQSDLVLTGAAESNFRRNPLWSIDSQVKVFRTARMVSLDWRREILAPGAVACQRRLLRESLGRSARVLSFERIPFPHIARYTAEFRGLVGIQVSNEKTVRLIVDIVLVSRGRSELSLATLARAAARAEVTADERRLVRTMLRRAKA